MYKCLCCGNETLPVPAEEAIAYICPVCWWENDVFLKSPDEPSDENHGMTLLEAHENYIKYGICDISPRLHLCTWKASFPQADALLGDSAPFLSVLEESPDNELHIRINAAEGLIPHLIHDVVFKADIDHPAGQLDRPTLGDNRGHRL